MTHIRTFLSILAHCMCINIWLALTAAHLADRKIKMVFNLIYLKQWLEDLEHSGCNFWDNLVVSKLLFKGANIDMQCIRQCKLAHRISTPVILRKGWNCCFVKGRLGEGRGPCKGPVNFRTNPINDDYLKREFSNFSLSNDLNSTENTSGPRRRIISKKGDSMIDS